MQFINLQKQYRQIKQKLDTEILDCLDSSDYILGQKVFELEDKLAKYVGVKECITCASGTDALLISLMSNNISLNDAVFTTNFSFFATAEVIPKVGATPIFVDIDKRTFNIDPELLELEIKKTISKKELKPKAIISVDLFGQLADYTKLEKIAKKYNLLLIQDAAQSFGAKYNNRKSCSFGDVAATSFYPAKPLGCYGDGGAVFTNDKSIADICRSIRVHGQGKNKYDNIRIGLNSRLDTIQAIVLLHKLEIFDKELNLRDKIADFYSQNLNKYVNTPSIKSNYKSSWAQYSILTKSENERNNLEMHLNANNIPTAIFYKKVFSDLEFLKKTNTNAYEVSKLISKSILSLPMHPYLSRENQNKVISSIKEFYE